MPNILLAFHGVLILLLSVWSFKMARILKIPITIHNSPIVILVGMGLYVSLWCAKYNPVAFTSIGAIIGVIVFIINSVEIPGQHNPSMFRKILMTLACVMFWPEVMVLLWVVLIHVRKLNEKPQH